jgi:Sugar-specific transcriptional regulator TrmB
MKYKNLTQSLQKLELSDFAIAAYLEILSRPNISISELCIITGQYRAKIYDAFEELKKIGLIERDNDFSRKIAVKPPSVVLTLLKQRQFEITNSLVDLEAELPYILANISPTQKNLSIRVFEGTNKFNYLMTTILDECKVGEEMMSFNESDDLYDVIGAKYFFEIWIEKRIQKKIFNRILHNPKNSFIKVETPRDTDKLRASKVLGHKYAANGCYWIIGKKVIMWDTVTPKAVLIENVVMADLMKASFEMIWENVSIKIEDN